MNVFYGFRMRICWNLNGRLTFLWKCTCNCRKRLLCTCAQCSYSDICCCKRQCKLCLKRKQYRVQWNRVYITNVDIEKSLCKTKKKHRKKCSLKIETPVTQQKILHHWFDTFLFYELISIQFELALCLHPSSIPFLTPCPAPLHKCNICICNLDSRFFHSRNECCEGRRID